MIIWINGAFGAGKSSPAVGDDHLAVYESSRTWMADCADLVVDTTALTPAEAAAIVLDQVQPLLERQAAKT